MANTLPIKTRIEEIPTILGFTKETFLRDKIVLAGYKPARYVAGYPASIDTMITSVEAIVNPKQITAEQKLITISIFNDRMSLRPLFDKLEGSINDPDATGFTIGKKDFGISDARKKNTSDEQEGLNGALLYLLGNLNATNMGILAGFGFLAADRTAIDDLRKNIALNNTAQNTKIDERANLVNDNYDVLVGACNLIKAQWGDGKSLFKSTDKTKLKDYVNAQVLNRIRQEELKTKIIGKAIIDGVQAKKAKVVARPIDGGRGKTVYTNANGEYELKGLKVGSYNITITLDGKSALVQADAVTGASVTAATATLS